MVVRAYAVCTRVTLECRWTESEMIGDGRGHADEADKVYHDIMSNQTPEVDIYYIVGTN